MNMTNRAGWPVSSPSETSLPLVSGSRKSGATVPSGSMVDGVLAMRKIVRSDAAKSSHSVWRSTANCKMEDQLKLCSVLDRDQKSFQLQKICAFDEQTNAPLLLCDGTCLR